MAAEPAGGGYRPGLDGVRALAVAVVLLFHLDRLDGGFLGVDAFFVVSGWLITWKLLNDVDRGRPIDLKRFWAARLRRIIPASAVVLIAIALVWPLANIEVPSLRRDLLWATGWASNWGTVSGGGDYWARFGEASPVTHFWSLAIEEQFYLVWPIVLAGIVWSSRSHRRITALVGALGVIVSIAVMNVLFDAADPTATYMNTFARAHSLLIGATVAAVTTVLADGRLRGGVVARRLAPAALVVSVGIMAFASEQAGWMFVWGFPAFALAVAVMVVAAADGMGERLLAWGPLRWLGDRSYGLYLWHWPIFLLLSAERLDVPNSVGAELVLDVGRVAVAVLVADLSLRFIESPIRQRRRLLNWRAPAAAGLSLVALLGLLLVVIPVSPSTSESSTVTLPPPSATEPPSAPEAPATPTASARPAEEVADTTPTSPVDSVPTEAGPTTVQSSESPALPLQPLRVLVTGDSTGVQLAEELIAYADTVPDRMLVGSAASAGCGLSAGSDGRMHEFTTAEGEREQVDLSGCSELWDSVPRRVVDEAIDVVVVNIGPWDSVDIHLPDGSVVSVGDASGRGLVAEAYERFVDDVRAAGATVMWVVPADTHLGWGSIDDPLNEPARWTALRSIIDGLTVVPIDLDGWLSANDLAGPDGRPDGVHLTEELRARFVVDQLSPALETERIRRAQL